MAVKVTKVRRMTRAQHVKALATINHVEQAILRPAAPTSKALREAYQAADFQTQSICDRLRDAWLDVNRQGFRG